MSKTSDYRRAYEATKRELAELLFRQELIGKQLIEVRQKIQTIAILCESEGVDIERSDEAAILLEQTTLANEIRMILAANHEVWLRPLQIKSELERLGRDLTKYKNPQATIHMVLKRIAESGGINEKADDEGKTVYMMPSPGWMPKLAAEKWQAAFGRNKK
jgi:hypothetical protein